MSATVLPAAPRPLRIVILGLSITSSWGNGHATTYRSLMRALCDRGHEVLFLECDKPWYREHRAVRFFRERRDGRVAGRIADPVVAGVDAQDGALVARHVGNGARTERRGIGRCPDYGNAPGVEQALQFMVPVDAAVGARGHSIKERDAAMRAMPVSSA